MLTSAFRDYPLPTPYLCYNMSSNPYEHMDMHRHGPSSRQNHAPISGLSFQDRRISIVISFIQFIVIIRLGLKLSQHTGILFVIAFVIGKANALRGSL